MKIRQLQWGRTGSMEQDEYSERVGDIQYHIGSRQITPQKSDMQLWVFGHGLFEKVSCAEEGKQLAQQDFEKWVISTFME